MTTPQSRIIPFELKSASEDGSTFAGYSNAFHNLDSAQEIVAPGAFSNLAEFMETGFIGGLNHEWDMPIGRPTMAREDSKGLYVEGKISDTAHGRDVKQLLKDGVIKKMSIGYQVLESQPLKDAEAVHAYWNTHNYTPNTSDQKAVHRGAKLLTKLHLFEFSPVTVPCNNLADITRVKAAYAADTIATERQFERFLREAGFSRKQAVEIALHGFKFLQREADEEDGETTPTEDQSNEQIVTAPIAPIAIQDTEQASNAVTTEPVLMASAADVNSALQAMTRAAVRRAEQLGVRF